MCEFFSFISMGDGKPRYFNAETRNQLAIDNPDNWTVDSHSSIALFHSLKEDVANKYEFLPIFNIFKVDQINNKTDDSELAKAWAEKFDFSEILKTSNFKINLRGTGITVLPENLTVGGNLDIQGTGITVLPEGLTVGGSLDLRGTGITVLPENLTVGGSLDIQGTGITVLPEGLTVGGSLYLRGTGITVLPEGLTVGDKIFKFLNNYGKTIRVRIPGRSIKGSIP